MMPCAWCEREATTVWGASTACGAHGAAARDLERARCDLRREAIPASWESDDAHAALRAAVERRDRNELRGGPPDASGWTIFG